MEKEDEIKIEEIEVENTPINNEIEEALGGGLRKLWGLISTLRGNVEFERAKSKVQYGISIGFNIEYVIRDHVEEYPDTRRVKIRGYKKTDLDNYWNELRLREMLMKDILRQIHDTGSQEEIV